MYKRPMYFILAAYMAVLFVWNYDIFTAEPLPSYLREGYMTGIEKEFSGEVFQKGIDQDRTVLYLKNTSLHSNIIVYLKSDSEYQIGNIIYVRGSLYSFSYARNPGEFDGYKYYQAQNIDYYCIETDSVLKVDKVLAVKETLHRMRQKMAAVYDEILEEDKAAVIKAMVLGDKTALSREIRNLYRSQGIGHILAISGLHISLIGFGIYKMLEKFIPYPAATAVLSILILGSYGLMTGLSVSAIRAIIMFCCALLAKVVCRTYDSGSALALSAVVVLLTYPLMAAQAGFLMSFGAVAGILMVVPVIRQLLATVTERQPWLYGVWVSMGINLALFPVMLYYYYEYPLYSVFLNVMIIPLAGVLLLLGILGGIAGLFTLNGGAVLLGGCHYILELYEKLCYLFERLPGSVLILGQPELVQILLYYIVLGVSLVMQKYRKKNLWLLLIIPAVCLVIYRGPQRMEVTIADVGQGDGIVLQTELGTTFLIDGGSSDIKEVGEYRLEPLLKAKGVTEIDYAIMTHGDEDHISGIRYLLETERGININNLMMPAIAEPDEVYLEIEKLAKENGTRVKYIKKGDILKEGEWSLTCLHPEKGGHYADKNDYSAVLQLQYKKFRMLLTGDLEMVPEQQLLAAGIFEKVQVLKVAHHGSKFSTTAEFLDTIQPDYAIISCGENNRYGHPHPELLERLEQRGVEIYTTSDRGAVTIQTDGSEIKVSTYLAGDVVK